MTAFLLKNEPTSVLYVASLRAYGPKAEGNQVLKGRQVAYTRPETGWAIHDQDESRRDAGGGPNPLAVQH